MSAFSLKSLFLCSLAGATALLAGCDRQSGPQPQPSASNTAADADGDADPAPKGLDRSHKGAAMPTVTLTDNTGETLDLAAFKGKPLLVNLWATWCAPCIAEMPALNDLIGREGELGMTVLPISQDLDKTGKVVEILRRRKLDRVEPWIDDQGVLGMAYGGDLPVTILFDAEGREVWRWVGGNDWSTPAALKLITEAR
ncbi:TlpA family protein disulfide reductase [Novosphingobium colocasiae]|uniref:TlpA family protein disulfide reductase n=1 Tax=Novosphingobium colocasiae TaxID=1256513 RepID=UPI001E33685C|nr:TlpA disulfide reductase family protein [Novosphingobium colocasiae]